MTYVLIILHLLITSLVAPSVSGEPSNQLPQAQDDLPQGDPYSEQQISSTVEVLLGVGNIGITAMNAWQLRSNRRNDLIAGLGVISGGVGIALGLHEAANYRTLDLIAGAAAVLSGGFAMLYLRSGSGLPRARLPFARHLSGCVRISPSGPQSLRPGARFVLDL